MPRQRVVGLVAVHVDHQSALGSQLAQQAHALRALGRGALEMRDAADHVDAEIERTPQVRQRTGRAQQPVLREGHELQLQVRRDAALHLQQRTHRKQPLVADIDMRADRQQPARHRPIAIRQRPFGHRLFGQQRLQLAPQRNAFEQRAAGVDARQAVAERGVHVEVRIDERRAQQPAGAVFFERAGWHRQRRAYRRDAALLHQHVDAGAAVGQRGVADRQRWIHGLRERGNFRARAGYAGSWLHKVTKQPSA